MNITAIQTFLAVVRLRNLNRAAEEMNITQSAVTARLDALDQSLGARLLNRSRKGATLTKEGYAFLEQAEVIVRMWQTAQTKISFPEGVTRRFSFVCEPALWAGLGEVWIEDLRSRFPETAFEIWTSLARDAADWLTSSVSDTALLSEPVPGADFESRLFSVDRLMQVSTRKRTAVKWDREYVYVDHGPGFRTQHAQAWSGDETATMTFSNPAWAKDYLLKTGGSAYLPQRMVQEELENGQLFAVEGSPIFDQPVFLSWRKSSAARFPWLSDQ